MSLNVDDNKTLLRREIIKRYNKFVISKKQKKIRLPVVSSIPAITASTEVDEEYIKKTYQLSEEKSKLIFVKKKFVKKGKSSNFDWQDRKAEPHGFYWQAKAIKIKQGVRWGIIKTESVTGKVIAALGQYRLITHERAAKGIISNTQHLKLNLVDFYQDRFEALQVIESLINRESSVHYQKTIEIYIKSLQMIQSNLQDYFAATELKSFYKEDAIDHLTQQIDQDIARAEKFLKLSTPNKQARGHRSLLEFVKQQMIYNLYEMQAINQEITYSPNRPFALTRGRLNDYIEDARKEIDSHRTDLRNRVTKKHHGLFAKKNKVITYDFAAEEHSPEREKQILLAISFIEKKDKINYTKNEIYTQKDQENKEKLTVIKATNWRTHRNASTWLKSSLYFMFNVIKSFFVETREWEEESWDNKNFHLYATELRAEVKARQPIWYALIHFCRIVFIAVKDVMHGIYDSGLNVVIKMPAQIINDYKASKKLPEFESIYKQVKLEIAKIKNDEKENLVKIKTECGLSNDEPAVSNQTETAQEQPTETVHEQPAEAAQEQPTEAAQEQPAETAQEQPIETAPDQLTETVQEQPTETA